MVRSAESKWTCDLCLIEWAIEPEPRYSSGAEWADISDGEIPKVDRDCVSCPFCGSESTHEFE